MRFDPEKVLSAIVTVGNEGGVGRGFAIETRSGDLYIVTAAHCIPGVEHNIGSEGWQPFAPNVMAPLDQSPSVAGCYVFFDPCRDIAVLQPVPLKRGRSFMDKLATLPIGNQVRRRYDAFLLSLENDWYPCTLHATDNGQYRVFADRGIECGMSGSPVVSADGVAVGIVVKRDRSGEGGVAARLSTDLPGWLLRVHLSSRSRAVGSKRDRVTSP